MAGVADESDLAGHAEALAATVEQVLPGWVVSSVTRLVTAGSGSVPPEVEAEALDAGQRAAVVVGSEVRALLAQDVDAQRTNPLAVLRRAVAYPTEVLRRAGVPPVTRADFEARAFPDDVYDLSPATWADIDPSLQEPGLTWGAAKAHVVLSRRRAEGNR
jgi:hypothetical protein